MVKRTDRGSFVVEWTDHKFLMKTDLERPDNGPLDLEPTDLGQLISDPC